MFKKTLITLAIASIIPLQAFAEPFPVVQSNTQTAQNASSIAGKNYARANITTKRQKKPVMKMKKSRSDKSSVKFRD